MTFSLLGGSVHLENLIPGATSQGPVTPPLPLCSAHLGLLSCPSVTAPLDSLFLILVLLLITSLGPLYGLKAHLPQRVFPEQPGSVGSDSLSSSHHH